MNKMHCGHFLLTRAHYCHAVENVLHHAYWQERFRWWCESESGPDLLKVPIFVHLAIASRPPDQDFELPKTPKINKSLHHKSLVLDKLQKISKVNCGTFNSPRKQIAALEKSPNKKALYYPY